MFASNHASVWLLTRPVEQDTTAEIGHRNLAADTDIDTDTATANAAVAASTS